MPNESANAAVTPLAGPGQHLPALDGVRGLAVLMVLVVHMLLFNNDNGNRWADALASVRASGWIGVDLFFVLSGFLITGILYDTLQDPHYFRNFYMRRFLRIFPLYYGFLFSLLILTPWLHVVWGGRQYVLLAYLQNTSIWFPVAGFRITPLYDLNHFWSLAVEEQFYLFWPLLVYLVKDRRRLIQASLFLSGCALGLRVLLYLHHRNDLMLGYEHEWTLCRMDTLMIGGCLALLLRGKRFADNAHKIYFRATNIYVWLVALGMVILVATHPEIDSNFLPMIATFGYTVIASAFAGLIYLAIQPNLGWNTFFRMRWLRSLGKYSYGIYVLHILVGHLLGDGIQAVLGTSLRIWLTPKLHSRPLAILIEFTIFAGVVYLAAWCSYNFYEVHFLRLKKYFVSVPRGKDATPTTAVEAVSQG